MKYIFITGLILGIFSCNRTKTEDSYFYLKHDYESFSSAYIDTLPVTIMQELKDSVYLLNYILRRESEVDTISYILKEDSIFEPIYFVNNNKDRMRDFQFVEKNEFSINFESYEVYKYAYNTTAIDGCVTHFWTPELGVFLIRSTTWRSMRILYSTNSETNDKINSLCRLIWQKPEFYFGCVERMYLLPESMADKCFEDYIELEK